MTGFEQIIRFFEKEVKMRKNVLFIISLLLGFSQIFIHAQTSKNSSGSNGAKEKAIYATDFVDADGWTKYVSSEGKFNVLLPAEPKRELKAFDSPLGKKDLISYTSTFNKVVYVVGFLDFKIPINDEDSLRRIYDSWQNGIRSISPDGDLDEKDTTYENKLAREITSVSGLMSIRAKAFFSKGKLFQLMTLNVIESNDALLREVSPFNEKFFNSLKLETTDNESKTVKLAGDINDGFYQNNFFNFSMNLPKDWLFINQEDTDLIKEESRSRAGQQKNSGIETSFKRTIFLFNLAKNEIGALDNASIIGAAESISVVKATLAQIANATALNFVKNSGYTMIEPIKYQKVDKTTFAVIHLKKAGSFGIVLYQKLYLSRAKDYIIEFVATYTNANDLLPFEDSFKTFKLLKTK